MSLEGQTIGKYRILKRLGSGEKGIVYQAQDNLDRLVAVKVLHPHLFDDPESLRRFTKEPAIQARLNNNYIVRIFSFEESSHGYIIVMEYVNGPSLAEKIKTAGTLSPKTAVALLRQILAGLQHAHEKGIIHRDIKPQNILLDETGIPKLTDFGLAKLVANMDATKTSINMVAGTMAYMPPEQFRSLTSVGAPGDIYALGMTFYQAIAGKLPFPENAGHYAVQTAIMSDTPYTPLTEVRPDVSAELSAVIMKAIEKTEAQRFQSAAEMRDALDVTPPRSGGRDPALSKSKTDHPLPSSSSAATLQPSLQPEGPSKKRTPWRRYTVIAIITILLACITMLIWLADFSTVEKDPPLRSTIEVADTAAARSGNINPDSGISATPGGQSAKVERMRPGVPNGKSVAGNGDDVVWNVVRLSRLRLGIYPKGNIYLDGNKVAPGPLSLRPGTHAVVFESERFGRASFSVRVRAGEEKKLTGYYERKLNIQSLNRFNEAISAKIYVNGEPVGDTPYANMLLTPGSYDITVVHLDYITVEGNIALVVRPDTLEYLEPLIFTLH